MQARKYLDLDTLVNGMHLHALVDSFSAPPTLMNDIVSVSASRLLRPRQRVPSRAPDDIVVLSKRGSVVLVEAAAATTRDLHLAEEERERQSFLITRHASLKFNTSNTSKQGSVARVRAQLITT